MSNSLILLDVSPFIYTGENAPSMSKARIRQFPVRGVNYFLKYLSSLLVKHSDIILCFDSASFRKSIDVNYKANRSHNADVTAQLEMLYTFLPKFGFTCLKQEGAEADDLIYTCVEKYKHKYRVIDIYTSDYDICHNVASNVNCLAVNSNTIDVSVHSFEAVLKIPYNTISAYKLFKGDKSDNIPPFNSNAQQLYEGYLTLLNQLNGVSPDVVKTKEFMLKIIDMFYTKILNEQELAELRKRVDLIYPKSVEFTYEVTPCSYYLINRPEYANFLYTLENTVAMHAVGLDVGSYDKELAEYMKNVGDSLSKGYYAIDNNIVKKCEKMDMDSFILKGF